jgi:hypothetical protein
MPNGKKEAEHGWPFLSTWPAMLPIRVLSVRRWQIGQRLFMVFSWLLADDAALRRRPGVRFGRA